MVSSQPNAETENTSTTNNSEKFASLAETAQEEFERERMLSLLCQEELSAPVLHASSNSATASIQRTVDQSKSSSSADASVMGYSLATNMSEEISRLIFTGEGRAGKPPRRNSKQLKRQKSDEDEKPPSLPFAPDESRSQLIFPEIPRGENLPMPINVSPKFVFLRPVTPEHQGRLNMALALESTTSGSSSIFRRNAVTPADAETMTAVHDSKKRKANTSPGAADTDLQLQLRSPHPQPPKGNQVSDIVDTATKMLSAMRATSSASGSTCTGQASLRSTSSTFTSTTSGLPLRQYNMEPNYQYPQSPANTKPTKEQPSDLEKLQLTPMSHYASQQQEEEEKGLFDDVFADEQDDALPDCSLDLMTAKELEPDTSVYMCSRDPNDSDIPAEISTENLERQPSRQLPWFPTTGTRQVLASQSSSALYFGDRNGGAPRAHNNNNLWNHQQQPMAPPAALANREEPTTYYGRKTRAPLIDDDEPEEEIKINLAEFFEQVERHSHRASTTSLERETSSLFTNPPPPSPRRHQQGVRMARTESITDGNDDIGGLLSHQLLPSPKHSDKNLRYSSSM